MEVDDWLLRKLFGAEAESRMTDGELVGLVAELSQASMARLTSEPSRLGEEKLGLQEETESLAFDNYRTFIQAAHASTEIYDEFRGVSERLERVVGALPELITQAKDFSAEASKISAKRATNTLALNKHTQILQVLEIPQVMDTCVRAGYWEEALELIQYVGKLNRRLGHIPIIAGVAEEVGSQRSALVRQLLDQLQLPLSLPQCLKVVGFLRRLGVFTEAELRLKFLLSRSAWLRSMLASITQADPYDHITRVMEQSRVHLFDIVTQYKAVFAEDEGPALGIGLGLGKVARPQLPTSLPAIFHDWMGREVERFLEVLEADLARGVGGRLDAVAAQLAYFGQSLGRVGADFRVLALASLERAAYAEFARSAEPGAVKLLEEIRAPNFLASVGDSGERLAAYAPSKLAASSSVSIAPPQLLMDVPSLAHYTNAVLGGLNALRGFAPLAIAERVAGQVESGLIKAAEELAALKPTTARDKERRQRAALLLGQVLAPFLGQCLEATFPPTSVHRALRQSSVAGTLRSGLGRLSAERVVEALGDAAPLLLPQPQPSEEATLKTEEEETTKELDALNLSAEETLDVAQPSPNAELKASPDPDLDLDL